MTHSSRSSNRRAFIQATAAGLVLPSIVRPRSLGAEDKLPASERTTIAVIGTGKMMYGSHLPHFLKMPEVQVVGVCDVDRTRRETAKQRVDEAYGNDDCSAVTNYQQVLDRDDIDAVAIATPDHWHGQIILDACRAGKDIYCEKPLTNTLIEAKMTMDAVNGSNIIFQTGSQQRASENFRFACELVRNGRIGKIKEVRVSVGGPPKPCDLPEEPIEPGLDWDRWLGPAPMRPYHSELSPRGMHTHFPNWRSYREYGGGGMTDWGAHHFDIAQWGLGMDNSGPIEIIPPEKPGQQRGVRFVYANGAEVVHGGSFGVEFIGTDGEIRVNRGKLESAPGGIIEKPIRDDEIHLYKAPSGSHGGHRQDWINCVRSRQQPNCPIEVGARSVAVCHLGNIAYLHAEELAGKTLKWDPQSWRFTNMESANQWQDYPYPRRAGYELPSA